jgi:hypothetical protein
MSRLNVDQIYTRTGTGSPAIREMPAFHVRRDSAQSVTAGTPVIVQFNDVLFDTNSYWDAVNYRYTPQIAGYYQFNGQVYGVASNEDILIGGFHKNAADTFLREDIRLVPGGTDLSLAILNFSGLIYLNGSTDNVQVFIHVNGTGTSAGAAYTHFQGFLVRPD